MSVLHLTLKKQWFDMILSGEKKEEYREIKPYWDTRLQNKEYDVIIFRNGYASDAPRFTIELLGIKKGFGNPKWGGDSDEVYILSLGSIISQNLNAKA